MSLYTQSCSIWTPAMITRLNHLKAMGFDVYEITRALRKEYNAPLDWASVLEKMQDLYFAEVFKLTTREMEELKNLPDPRNEEETEKRNERKRKRALEAEGGLTGLSAPVTKKRRFIRRTDGIGTKNLGGVSSSVLGLYEPSSLPGPKDDEATQNRLEKERKRVMDVRELINPSGLMPGIGAFGETQQQQQHWH